MLFRRNPLAYVPSHIHASSGEVRVFDTHTLRSYNTLTYIRATIVLFFECKDLGSERGCFSSLEYLRARARVRRRLCLCDDDDDTHTYTRAASRQHTRTCQMQVARRVLSIYRVFYCNRCLLLRGPGDAVTFSAPPLLELPPVLLPRDNPFPPFSLARVLPPLLTEKRFSPFLPRDRALTLARRGSGGEGGGGKHEAQQRRRREAAASFPSHFFLPSSLPLSRALPRPSSHPHCLSFFLCAFFFSPPSDGRQYFRTSEAITIVISG